MEENENINEYDPNEKSKKIKNLAYNKNNYSFKHGVFTGIVISIAFVLLFNSCKILYDRFYKHELPRNQKIAKIISTIDKNYVNDYNEEDLEQGVYAGIVASLKDKYSYYMSPDEFNDYMNNTNGSYVGIGIIVSLDGDTVKVSYVFDGSPAQNSGLEVGDILRKVDGTEINKDNYSDLIKAIKDEKNKDTTVTIYRESKKSTMDIKINKSKIDMPTVSHKMLEDKIGYIMISKFEGVTLNQFNSAFDDLNKQDMQALIIDLRDNPGGLLNVVADITDKLVPKGYITYTEDKNGEKKYLYSTDECFGKPLVLLVNSNSASASEVLSGAVKDMGMGKLVGTKTYGKGVVQTLFKLEDGSGIKLTTAKYYTPIGVCIDGVGIKPDYEVDFEESFDFKTLNDDNDVQLKKGIEVIKEMLNK